jgi:hypothetical protein
MSIIDGDLWGAQRLYQLADKREDIGFLLLRQQIREVWPQQLTMSESMISTF